MTEEELVWLDLLVNRFSKLQDLMDAKIIDKFLDALGENTITLTMLDKINKLERLGLPIDQDSWKEMRDARNHASQSR